MLLVPLMIGQRRRASRISFGFIDLLFVGYLVHTSSLFAAKDLERHRYIRPIKPSGLKKSYHQIAFVAFIPSEFPTTRKKMADVKKKDKAKDIYIDTARGTKERNHPSLPRSLRGEEFRYPPVYYLSSRNIKSSIIGLLRPALWGTIHV